MTETQTSTAASAPRAELTWQAIVAAFLVAAIMGVTYPYMVLKLGFGPNVSVVAAFFGFLLLNLISRKTYDRWQNNIVQTAGTSAAQTAFMCVLLGAFDILHDATGGRLGAQIAPYEAFLWLTVAGMLGVLMAVPLRRHFIVDQQLPFADGVAAGETLIVLDPPRDGSDKEGWERARRAAKALGIGLLLSAFVMVIREDSKMVGLIKEGWAPDDLMIGSSWVSMVPGVAAAATFVVANMGVGVSYSLLSIGSGMLIGLRINVSMILGGLLAWVVFPYFLVKFGILPSNPSRRAVLYWIMWPATGMLVAGGLAALALRWRLLVKTFTSLRGAKIDSTEFPLRYVVGGIGILSVLLAIVQYTLLDMPIWMTFAAIVLSIPLMLVGLRVLGETNWGPISALSNMMQGLFAVIAKGNVSANMVASGTTGTIAVSSEAIMQDFKAGDMIGSTPRSMTIAQLMAVPIGAAAVAWTYPALVETYGLIERVGLLHPDRHYHPELASPISVKWSGFAQLLETGTSNLESSALLALLIFAGLGILFTVLEDNKKLKPFIPSPTGVGIGMLVPFAVIATMFLGGVAGTIWEKVHKKSSDDYCVPFASGMIAGEAIVAVIALPLIMLGLGWGFPEAEKAVTAFQDGLARLGH